MTLPVELRAINGGLNVIALRGFIAAGKQKDYFTAGLREVNPISGTVVDTQFRNALTNRFAITEIAAFDTLQPYYDTCLRIAIAQTVEPSPVFGCCADCIHGYCSSKATYVKWVNFVSFIPPFETHAMARVVRINRLLKSEITENEKQCRLGRAKRSPTR
jgi:hypothetical protein